jgi:hypothetical protein
MPASPAQTLRTPSPFPSSRRRSRWWTRSSSAVRWRRFESLLREVKSVPVPQMEIKLDLPKNVCFFLSYSKSLNPTPWWDSI